MTKFKIAIAGCGNVSKRHFEAADINKYSILTACCDIIAERADDMAEKYNITAFYDFDRMLEDADFDILHICTPHYLHAPMAIKAMEAGKHVFCEKPLAIKYDDAIKMCECSEKNNVYLAACFQNRYNNTSTYLKELINSRRFGDILGIKANVTWNRDEKYYSDDWHGTLEKEGGGVIINQCIHTLDLIQWLIDDTVTAVDGSISQKRLAGKIETEDTADAVITFSNGIKALFYGSLCFNTNSPVFLEIIFENGRAVMYDDLVVYDKDNKKEIIDIHKTTGKHSYWGSGHSVIINDFYNCIAENSPFLVNGRSGSIAVKIVDELYKSARK